MESYELSVKELEVNGDGVTLPSDAHWREIVVSESGDRVLVAVERSGEK